MYRIIEGEAEVAAYVESLKLRSKECAAYQIGVATFVVFFHNLDSDGGYVLMTHDRHLKDGERFVIDITDERKIMKIIVDRESHGTRDIDDEQLDKIFTILEPFRTPADMEPITEETPVFIKEINGQKIYHLTLGDVYYFNDEKENWLFEDKSLKLVEEVAEHYVS